MNEQNKEQCLLYIVASTDVESTMVDWLIASDQVKGFSSMPISGHGSGSTALSIIEQIEGRRQQMLYLIRLPQIDMDAVLQALKQDLGHIGIEYWVVPVNAHGKII